MQKNVCLSQGPKRMEEKMGFGLKRVERQGRGGEVPAGSAWLAAPVPFPLVRSGASRPPRRLSLPAMKSRRRGRREHLSDAAGRRSLVTGNFTFPVAASRCWAGACGGGFGSVLRRPSWGDEAPRQVAGAVLARHHMSMNQPFSAVLQRNQSWGAWEGVAWAG